MTKPVTFGTGSIEFAGTVLERLSQPVRTRLAEMAHALDYPAGAVVLRDGADTPFLGAIESGRVALRLRVPEIGDRLTMLTCEPGDLIGWSAVVAPYRATVDAISTEPTRILALEAAALRQRLASDRELAAELLPIVLESVSGRLNASWQQLLDMFAPRAAAPW
jgi:CRP/FNR family cyclic AMP-dependent transcriptional regulator